MEYTERCAKTWMASGRPQEVEETAQAISDGKSSVLDVVKALGEYLTSEDDVLRAKGVEFLSLVLANCTPESLTEKTSAIALHRLLPIMNPSDLAHRLSVFYCSKLEDTETIIPALKGLISLAKLSSCTAEDAIIIVKAMFVWVNMKALVQAVRFNVFSIFDIVMTNHREALKAMGREFMLGYLKLAEGEKDPRNLLVAFAIAKVILLEFEIEDFIETLFNVTFCYFPITFRPPPNDPYGITTDDLRLALRSCLNATPLFGPLAIPLFLEKLLGGSPVTKRDTLETMSACLPVYGSALLATSYRKLWNSLKLEVFQPTDQETESVALFTLKALISTLYSNVGDLSSDDGLIAAICAECLDILKSPDTSQAKPAIKILSSSLSTIAPVSRYVAAQTVPHLLNIFANLDDTSSRSSVLLLLSDFIAAAREVSKELNLEENPLSPFKDELLSLVSAGIIIPAARRPSLACLLGMVSSKQLLSDDELRFIVHTATQLFQETDNIADGISETILQLLSTVSELAPRHIEQETLPLFFSSLPDRAPAQDMTVERGKYQRTLRALKILCQPPDLFEVLVIHLTTKLDILGTASTSEMSYNKEATAAYAHSILTCILQTLTAKIDDKHTDIPKYIERLVTRLFNLIIYSAYTSEESYYIYHDHRTLQTAGRIVTLVVQVISFEEQQEFSNSLIGAYLSGSVKEIAVGQQKMTNGVVFQPFSESASSEQRNLLVLFSSGIISLRARVELPVPNLVDFLVNTLSWALQDATNDLQRTAAWRLTASILNKRVDDLSSFTEKLVDSYWTKEVKSGTSVHRRQNAIQSWAWICKALVVRAHPLASFFTGRLFELLGDIEVNWEAAKAFGSIISVDGTLTKEHHAIVKLLYAQRYVNANLPPVVAGAEDTNNPISQPAHLVALASLIKAAPKATYATEISKLVPLLLRGLELPDQSIRADVIATFLAFAETDSQEKGLIANHATSLVASMLMQMSLDSAPSVKLRVSAIQYLGKLPSIVSYDVLHPQKSIVIRALAEVLDDPKRVVRTEAVDARNIWFKYGGSS